MSTLRSVCIRRAVKINTGNYENTDISVELTANLDDDDSYITVADRLISTADQILKEKIDEIELGKRKIASKTSRFGL